jgi:polysaccharide biosynthesis transport protein
MLARAGSNRRALRVSFPSQAGGQEATNALIRGLRVLRRRWLIVSGVVLACLIVAVVQQARTAKTFKATANVTFQTSTLSEAALQVGGGRASTEPQREAETNVLIAHSAEVAAGVVKELGGTTSISSLLDKVNVEAASNADVLNITASTGDPRESARLANAFAEQYIAFEATSQLSSIAATERQLQQQISVLPAGSGERATLEKSLQRLSELRAVAGGSAQIIGRARLPSAPSGIGTATAAGLGVLVGLAIAVCILFLVESLDSRVKSIEEFEQAYRLPALAAVPQSAFRDDLADKREDLLEPYRILRAALDFVAVTRQLKTLLITSAISAEGKTTVAVGVSHAIALTGRRVVLVELDMRRPTIARHFGLAPGQGLTTALTRPDSVRELLIEPFSHLLNFSVLQAGLLPPNPSELLGSANLIDVLAKLMTSDGIVILDAPPLNPIADTQVLLNQSIVDGAVLVARVERTTRSEVSHARAILDRHTVEAIGLVVTGLREPSRYGYAWEDPYAPGGTSRREGNGDVLSPPRSFRLLGMHV